jgi:hypothetical protein
VENALNLSLCAFQRKASLIIACDEFSSQQLFSPAHLSIYLISKVHNAGSELEVTI